MELIDACDGDGVVGIADVDHHRRSERGDRAAVELRAAAVQPPSAVTPPVGSSISRLPPPTETKTLFTSPAAAVYESVVPRTTSPEPPSAVSVKTDATAATAAVTNHERRRNPFTSTTSPSFPASPAGHKPRPQQGFSTVSYKREEHQAAASLSPARPGRQRLRAWRARRASRRRPRAALALSSATPDRCRAASRPRRPPARRPTRSVPGSPTSRRVPPPRSRSLRKPRLKVFFFSGLGKIVQLFTSARWAAGVLAAPREGAPATVGFCAADAAAAARQAVVAKAQVARPHRRARGRRGAGGRRRRTGRRCRCRPVAARAFSRLPRRRRRRRDRWRRPPARSRGAARAVRPSRRSAEYRSTPRSRSTSPATQRPQGGSPASRCRRTSCATERVEPARDRLFGSSPRPGSPRPGPT